jgi:hypothetical protein
MDFCHQHNVSIKLKNEKKNFGIKVTLPLGDTLGNLLGENWSKQHWYNDENERDLAFEKMKIRHGYYRKTDNPSQIIEKITRQ